MMFYDLYQELMKSSGARLTLSASALPIALIMGFLESMRKRRSPNDGLIGCYADGRSLGRLPDMTRTLEVRAACLTRVAAHRLVSRKDSWRCRRHRLLMVDMKQKLKAALATVKKALNTIAFSDLSESAKGPTDHGGQTKSEMMSTL